jgi:hypothetical protein
LRVYNLHKQSRTRSLAKQRIKNGKDSQAALFRQLEFEVWNRLPHKTSLSIDAWQSSSVLYHILNWAPRVASSRITFSRVHSDYPSDGNICLSTFYNTSKWLLNRGPDQLVRLGCSIELTTHTNSSSDAPGPTYLAYTPNGNKLITVGLNNVIRIFTTGSDAEPVNIDVIQDSHTAVAATNNFFLTGSEDGSVCKYSLSTHSLEEVLVRSTLPIRDISISPDGLWAAVASEYVASVFGTCDAILTIAVVNWL